MPKSSSLTLLAAGTLGIGTRNTLSGLRSRWTMPGVVRGVERARDLRASDRDRLGRAAAAALDALASASRPRSSSITMYALPSGSAAEVEDLDDAGVPDRGRRARLVEEPLDDVAIASTAAEAAP